MSEVDSDDTWAFVDQTFPLDSMSWKDLLSLSSIEREQAIKNMLALGQMTWTQRPGALDALRTVLDGIGVVGGIAGAASGVIGLIAAMKGL